MSTIASLGIRVTTDGVTQATRQLDALGEAGQDTARTLGTELPKASDKVAASMDGLRRPLKAVSVGLAAAFAGASLLAVRKWSAAFEDLGQTLRNAREVGVTAEQFSRLEFAARASDVAVEDLSGGMRNLTRFMAEAAKGGKEQAGLLDQLGVAATNADGSLRPMHAVLRDIAEQFPKIEGPTNRSAVAMKLFGEQGARLVPILEDGAQGLDRMAQKSDELGYTFTGPMLTGSKEIKRQFAELKLSMDGLWRQSLAELLPRMQDLASLMNSPQFRSGFQAIVNGATASATALAGLVAKVGQVSEAFKTQEQQSVQFLQDQVNAFQRQIDEINNDETGAFRIRAALGFDNQKLIDDLEAQKAPIQAEIDRRLQFTMPPVEAVIGGANGPVTIDWGALGGDKGGGRAKAPRVDNSLRDALREAQRLAEAQGDWRDQMLDLAADLQGPVAVANRDYEKQLAGLERAFQSGEVALADYAKMQGLLAQARDKELAAIEERMNPQRQLLDDLQFELGLMKKTNAERAAAIQMRGWDAASIARYGDEVAAANKKIEDSMLTAGALDDLRRGFGDAFADFVTGASSAREAFEDFADGITRRLAQMAGDNLAQALFGAFGTTGGGSAGNWISDLFALFAGSDGFTGFARGGYTGDGPRNEIAGVVHRGEYVINADTVRRLRSGAPVAAGAGAGMGQTYNFQPTIMVQGKVDRRTAGQIAVETGREIRRATARYGG